jgi:hypothetical protein
MAEGTERIQVHVILMVSRSAAAPKSEPEPQPAVLSEEMLTMPLGGLTDDPFAEDSGDLDNLGLAEAGFDLSGGPGAGPAGQNGQAGQSGPADSEQVESSRPAGWAAQMRGRARTPARAAPRSVWE